MSRTAAILGWIVLAALAFGLSPPARPDQTEWLLRLLSGQWAGEEPLVVAQFQWMGLWPMVTALLIRGDWRARPVPAWPFVLGSFALGCFVLLPWFALRRGERAAPAPGPLAHPVLPLVLAVAAVALAAWALVAGDPARFVEIVRADGFVWPMTFDFGAFWVLSVVEARARARHAPWALALVPLVGLAAFLALEARAAR